MVLKLLNQIKKEIKDKKLPIDTETWDNLCSILNMIDSYSDDEIDLILKKNFYAFRMMSTHHRQKRMKISFSKKCRILKMMKYVTNDGKLTEKGLFAKKIIQMF